MINIAGYFSVFIERILNTKRYYGYLQERRFFAVENTESIDMNEYTTNSSKSLVTGGTYDLLLMNNATKAGYVIRNLKDTGGETCFTFNLFQLSSEEFGDIPFGEYTYALVGNMGYREYDFKDNLLDTVASGHAIKNENPATGLFKYVDEAWVEKQNEPTYRDTDKEFYYRRKNN